MLGGKGSLVFLRLTRKFIIIGGSGGGREVCVLMGLCCCFLSIKLKNYISLLLNL